MIATMKTPTNTFAKTEFVHSGSIDPTMISLIQAIAAVAAASTSADRPIDPSVSCFFSS